MRRLSSDLERKIVELWYQGFSRDAIAKAVGVAAGTVTNIIATFPNCLTELRDFSVQLRKTNALPSEALKGADLLVEFDRLGVKLTQVRNLIEALQKQSEVAGYQPAQVVEAALALHSLEKQSGRSYAAALMEFEHKTKQTERLSKKAKELRQEVAALKEQRKQALQEAAATDEGIRNLKTTENGLCQHGLTLGDPQSLLTYLQRVREMGGSPKQFIEFSKKYDSFKEALSRRQDAIEKENSRFNTLKSKSEALETRIIQQQNYLGQLGKQETNRLERIDALRREESETSRKVDEKRAELAESLKAGSSAEEIAKAINESEQKLAQLRNLNLKSEQEKSRTEADLTNIRNQIVESHHNKEALGREISKRLKIKDFTTEHQQGIDRLKQEKINLDKEVAQRRGEVALQETLKNFYVRQSQYDFSRFHQWVELLKYIREKKPETLPIITAQIESDIRKQALQVFKGFLVPKFEFEALENENNQHKSEAQELRNNLKARDAEISNLKNENQHLAKIKLTVESRQTTLKALRDWMILQCNEEIDARVREKFNSIAAGTYGILDFVYRKITRKDIVQQEERQ